jgi:heat-inducible transcriptional repressor
VARSLGEDVSSATIRNEMARLEREGLLTKLHHSAGRAPTDTGFRVFVNQLLSRGADTTGTAALAPLVERELDRSAGAHAVVKALAALLCRLTDNIGIIMGPAWDGVRARRVDLYRKEGRRILMVLTLDNALVRTGTFRIEQDVTPEILDDAARILSERVYGKSVARLRAGALDGLPDDDSPASRVALDLARQGDELFSDVEETELELMGVANVLDEPEFQEPERLKKLVRFLESPREIRSALRRLSPENDEGIAVWIGSENPIDELRPFSLVSSAFPLDGQRGVLAVLGLRRMPYDRAIHGLQTLVDSLKQMP